MAVDATLEALADPTRRRLVELLGEQPRRAGDLARAFTISRPGVARHLRVLREAGVVAATSQGRERIYHLAPGGLDDIRTWIDRMDATWDAALASLKVHLEGEPDGDP